MNENTITNASKHPSNQKTLTDAVKAHTGSCIGPAGVQDVVTNVPTELSSKKQFILWRPEWNELKGKFNKIPTYLVAGEVRNASYNRTDKFLTLAQAHDSVLRAENKYRIKLGIGFSFVGQDEYSGIDLDGVLIDGELTAVGQGILNVIPGWCEVSSSGTGLHLIFKTNKAIHALNDKKNHALGIEFFCNTGYFALTGKQYE